MRLALPGSRAPRFVEVERHRNVDWAYHALVWVAFLLVWVSAASPARVESQADSARIGFGYPADFLYVDRSARWAGEYTAPPNPWEDEFTAFRVERFLFDWAAFALVLCAPLFIARWRRR